MKISADQIEKKSIAGHTEDGRPVVYIMTKGGLHALFVKDKDGIMSIGASPHVGISKYLAGKKEKIKWNDGFEKSEDNLSKSEGEVFVKLRKMMFMKSFDEPAGPADLLLVYDMEHRSIEIVDDKEFDSLDYPQGTIVRSCDLISPVVLAGDFRG